MGLDNSFNKPFEEIRIEAELADIAEEVWLESEYVEISTALGEIQVELEKEQSDLSAVIQKLQTVKNIWELMSPKAQVNRYDKISEQYHAVLVAMTNQSVVPEASRSQLVSSVIHNYQQGSLPIDVIRTLLAWDSRAPAKKPTEWTVSYCSQASPLDLISAIEEGVVRFDYGADFLLRPDQLTAILANNEAFQRILAHYINTLPVPSDQTYAGVKEKVTKLLSEYWITTLLGKLKLLKKAQAFLEGSQKSD